MGDRPNGSGPRATVPWPRRAWLTVALALAAICAPLGLGGATAAAGVALTPSATAAPALTGIPSVGETLRCSSGSWTNDPTSFAYVWLRDGVPIAGQTAAAYVVRAVDEGHSIACEVTAKVLGDEYQITGLPSESYRVLFSPTAEANYLAQYFSGESSVTEATPVAVRAPGETPNVDATLAIGGEITGRVTNQLGAPLADIEVCIGFLHCRHTDANGEYVFAGLSAGGYKVLFNGEALDPSCYEPACEEYEAQRDEVTVTPPDTTGVDAVLTSRSIPSGSITGTVSSAPAGILVCAQLYEQAVSPIYCEATDDSGSYTISKVPTGQYSVGFYPEGKNYIAVYYEGALDLSAATKVSVTAGEATEVDETLEEGGEISGRVTGESGGAPLAGIEACAYDYLLLDAVCAKTDAEGDYTLVGLPTDSTYNVDFARNQKTAYLPTVKNSVAVVVGSTKVLDVALEEGGSITGRVTTSRGTPFTGGKVCASEPNLPDPYKGTKCALADADGHYAIVGLAEASEYEVFFHGEQCGEGGCVWRYLGEPYGQPVSVRVATSTPGINADLAEGGKITGAITAVGGGVLSGRVNVCAHRSGPNDPHEKNEWCAPAYPASASASARSNAFAIARRAPAGEQKSPPRRHFKLLRKRFDARAKKLDLFFRVFYRGSLRWKLRFRSAGGGKRKGKAHREARGSFGSGSRRVSPGRVEVKVRASAKARKALRSGRLLRVRGKVSFRPASGDDRETVRINARVHQGRRRRAGHRRRRRSDDSHSRPGRPS